jgi:hypothetical protein
MEEAVARGLFSVRKSDGVSAPEEHLPPDEILANGLDLNGTPSDYSRNRGGRESLALRGRYVYRLLFQFRELTGLMLEHSLQGVGHDGADFVFIQAARSCELIQHADHKQWVAVASPVEWTSQRIVEGRLSESPRDVIADVVARQLVQ